jgi:hypothetical protein
MTTDTTRRFPRTMEEAFGPGHRGGLYVEYEPMNAVDLALAAIAIAVAVGCIVYMALS